MDKKDFLLFSAGVLFIAQLVFSNNVLSQEEPYALLVDDFDHGKMYNLLYGKTQGDEEKPGGCVPNFTNDPAVTYGRNGSSLKLDFDVTVKESFSYYWSKFSSKYQTIVEDKVIDVIDIRDLSEYDYLSFWMMDPQGGVDFTVELHQDVDEDGVYLIGKDISAPAGIKRYHNKDMVGKWQKIAIPLSYFKSITDWRKIMELVFVFRNGRGIPNGTVYIDDILFGKGYGQAQMVDPTTVVIAPYRSTFKCDGENLRDGFAFKTINNLSVETTARSGEPRLEYVKFEYSDDGGQTWRTIAKDYDLTDHLYNAEWTTTGLGLTNRYLVKATVGTISGVESPMVPAIADCTIRR